MKHCVHLSRHRRRRINHLVHSWRSKSFGNSVSKAFNEAVSKLEMGHDSRNKQFHKLFPCVPDTESVINTYSCALVRDILLQGRMFVSENWICFHSNIFSYEKQIAIKVETITKITKEKTAFVVPNAIGLHTPSEKVSAQILT
ncbi:protein Aster-B-like isoform X1 [Lytechinus pictus]|uniref:protein Aster-B-like isoform X1 n=1 Tax=Lytechinus pictus TaxID=7653 RepID=UPI00240DFC87|nr:protein Aster-B-like [Lytechinus pictus]